MRLPNVEYRIEAAVESHERRYVANREQSAVHVWPRRTAGVVADRQPLIRHPEHHLGADHVARQPDRVHLRARERRAACLTRADRLVDRYGGARVAHGGQACRELSRRSAWRIDLRVARVVDDLPLRDELRRHLGELLQQDDRERKVAAREHAPLVRAGRDVDLGEIGLGETRRADDHMGAVLERREDVGLRAIGMGVLDEHVTRSGECVGRGPVQGNGEARVA